MTLTVYTAIFQNSDEQLYLKTPTVVNPSIRYVCLTDTNVASDVWDVRRVVVTERSPRRMARRCKVLFHKYLEPCDASLWVDSRFRLTSDALSLWNSVSHENCDIWALVHPDRSNLRDEADTIIQLGKDDKHTVDAQLARYGEQCFGPQLPALTSTGFLLRRHSWRTRWMSELWWDEISNGSHRDQLSIDYAACKSLMEIRYLQGHYRDNPYALWSKKRGAVDNG